MAKESLKEKLRKRAEDLKRSSGGANRFLTFKEGTTRIRVLPVGEDVDFSKEVIHIYLGQNIGGLISPQSLDQPCAVFDKQQELSKSTNPEDKDLAKMFVPKRRFVLPVIVSKDERKSDYEDTPRVALISSNSLYQDIINIFLDDEYGDFTDPVEGFDLKIIRTGKGKTDTTYSVMASPKASKLPKSLNKVYDIDEMLEAIVPPYEETETMLHDFLIANKYDGEEDEEEERKPKKSINKKKSPGIKKKSPGIKKKSLKKK